MPEHSVIIDTETYSDLDIEEVGAIKYLSHPSAYIRCMAYKVDDQPTKLWVPGRPIPLIHELDANFYAHNAFFDINALDILKWPYQFPFDRWIDTMALCARYNLPMGLLDAGTILKARITKNPDGKKLIKRCCTPQDIPPTQEELNRLYRYCMDDVDSTYELLKKLPADHLSAYEQKVWQLTFKMNRRGLPADVESAKAIYRYCEIYKEEHLKMLPMETGGAVSTPGQIEKIKVYCSKFGVKLDNLQAQTVEDLLLQPDLRPEVRHILNIRQNFGRTSTAKYIKLMNYYHEGYLYDSFWYYGAGTGRWTGKGFQPHNMPRATVPDPEAEIKKFIEIGEMNDPIYSAKALIRSMIQAKEGTKIAAADYSSIEYILLVWLAEEKWAVDMYRNRGDAYVDMAAYIYSISPEEVTKFQRQVGKVIILGCGFIMGANRLVESGKGFGILIPMDLAEDAVSGYRERYAKVKALWKNLHNCAVSAVARPTNTYKVNRCEFSTKADRNGNKWLAIKLPSGRSLFYMNPTLEPGKFGYDIKYWGTNPKTKQWSRRTLTAQQLVENIIQGSAADIMRNGLFKVEELLPQFEVIGSVHDEALSTIHDTDIHDDTLAKYCDTLCDVPEWCKDMPLFADGYIERRYRKG